MTEPFVTGLRECTDDASISLQGELSSVTRLQEVIKIRAWYECPKCVMNMTIAGRYDKSDRTVEGISKNMQHLCYQCNVLITPKLKGS